MTGDVDLDDPSRRSPGTTLREWAVICAATERLATEAPPLTDEDRQFNRRVLGRAARVVAMRQIRERSS